MPTTSGTFGWHLPVAGDAVDVVSDLAATVADIEDTIGEFGIRFYRTRITVPTISSLASGGSVGPYAVTFPVGRFTAAPSVFLSGQDLPSGANWLYIACTEPTTSGVNVYVYNQKSTSLSTTSGFDVAVLAVQDPPES